MCACVVMGGTQGEWVATEHLNTTDSAGMDKHAPVNAHFMLGEGGYVSK